MGQTFSVMRPTIFSAKETPEQNKGQGTLHGRSVVHWSYTLLMSGAIVGGATALIGMATASLAAQIFGCILLAIGSLGAYFVKDLSYQRQKELLQKDMEENAKTGNSQLEQERNNVEALAQENRRTEENVATTQQLLEQLTARTAEQKALHLRIETLTNELRSERNKQASYIEKIDTWIRATNNMTTASEDLSTNVANLIEQKISFIAELNALRDNSSEWQPVQQQLEALKDAFSQNIQQIQENKQRYHNERNTLRQKISDLKKENEHLHHNIETLQNAVDRIENLMKSTTPNEDEIAKMVKLLRGLKTHATHHRHHS